MAEVSLQSITKQYGRFTAVSNLSMDIERGEFIALLGPSGCGKTTVLRMLGGFIPPTSGRIELRGTDVTSRPPHHRDTAMVFQSYALFPHMSVRQNVGYGLRRRRVARAEIDRRVDEVLDLVRLRAYADRRPHELSGGQQQRAAVARALVVKPAVLLLDEPFSALDAQVRESTRLELRRIQQDAGITALFVTHDQEEALAISDRAAIMNGGRIEQIAEPMAIYDRPATEFVADFIGGANIFAGRVERTAAGRVFRSDDGLAFPVADEAGADDAGILAIRAEEFSLAPPGGEGLPGAVVVTSYLGAATLVIVRLDTGREVTVRSDKTAALRLSAGSRVSVGVDPAGVRLIRR